MIKNTIGIIASIISFTCARAQDFIWAKSFEGNSTKFSRSIAVDSAGNVYTTGYYTDSVDFDPGIGKYYLSSKGNYDIFITKVNADGDFVWAKSFGGPGQENPKKIVLDKFGNIYLGGEFRDSVDFHPQAGVAQLVSKGQTDIFLLKLDSDGNLIWVKSFGGLGYDFGGYLYTDGEGNPYTAGEFYDTVDFDPGPGVFNLISNGGSYDIFILKLDTSGAFVWAKSVGSPKQDRVKLIVTDGEENVLIAGDFHDTMDFDPGSGIYRLSSNGNQDLYFLKLDNNGNFKWARSWGSPSGDYMQNGTADSKGNVYICGYLNFEMDFDPGVGVYKIAPIGEDIYVHKLDSAGNFAWARTFSGLGEHSCYAIEIDTLGNVYTTGEFELTVDFDPGADSLKITSAGKKDIFIHKMNAQGNLVWVKTIGGTGVDYGQAIKIDGTGNINVTGNFVSKVDFNPEKDSFFLQALQRPDIFVLKLGQNNSVSLPELNLNFEVQVYPNPTSGLLNVIINSPVQNGVLTVMDLTGKSIHSANLSDLSNNQIHLDVPAGMYYVAFKTSGGQSVVKLMVE